MTRPFLTFVGSGVPIWAIQGDGETSPYVRSIVTTDGVVTAVFPELGGFWMQEIDTDDDPATSAGIFVLAEPLPDGLAAGDGVQLTGKVREASGQTLIQLSAPDALAILSSGNPLPEPAAYNPPADPAEALAYNESLEGMWVTLDGPAVAIAPTTKYGEYVLVDQDRGVDRVTRPEEVGFLIFVDDGSSAAHEDASTLPYTIARGDVVDGLTGPLAFTFDNYKIEPVAVPEIVRGERPVSALPEPGTDEITIATFNVENFFDNMDPHPSSPPKPGKTAYATKLHKLAEAIVAMGAPTIIGMQEVENIGVLEDLVAQEPLAAYQYRPYLIEGTDARGIDVGYLVRGDQAVVDGVAAYPAPEGLTSRPPLVITVTVNLASGPETITVLNNHFTSMSAGEAATEPRRTAQAAWNVTLVQQLLADDPEAQIVVLGDLNSFYQTPPLDTLQNAGLAHAYDIFGEEEALPYTYIYQGKTQSLDHILMTRNLYGRLGSVDVLHINADYPLPLPDDTSPHRVSDHDPLVVRLSFSH
jgi:predicted extracellular nuclease